MEIAEKPSSEIRTANDWINGSKKRPIPAALFGEFWRQGETAILFAETGKRKSALAMQVAQSIASGKRIMPFKTVSKPQNVLHLDLEMNDKQFEMRHAADHDGGRAKFLRKHFVFSETLYREELDPADFWVKGERTCDVFKRTVRQLVKKTDASVVIIDSLTCLKRSYYGSREILDLITELKKLQREMNISILALVQSPKHSDSQSLSVNSLRGMKLLCGRADSVFGIGQSRFDPFGRYIKRIKSLGDAIDFDAMHVPTFRLKKLGGNFLGFEFQGFMPEAELISDIRASKEWNTIEKIKQLNDGGMSIRAIADKIDLPKTTVHRLLQMWRPPDVQNAANAAAVDDPKRSPYYFPGREEYDEAGRDPRFQNNHNNGPEEYYRLLREGYLIQSACAKAHEEYKKTGQAPRLAEMLETMKQAEDTASSSDLLGVNELDGVQLEPPATAGGTDKRGTEKGRADETHVILQKHTELLKDLKRSYDHNGQEIFVEKEDDRGRPIVWYKYDSKGRLYRWERDSWGSVSKQIDGPPPVL